MTIPAGQSGVTYHTGNGTASTFDYEFKITAEVDLKVTQTDTAGVDTVLVLNTDYTVTGVGNNAGGSITLVAGALASNYTLAIEDNVEVSQLTPFGNQSAFYANLHEDSYDKNTRIARKAIYEVDRSIKIPGSVQGVDTELPKPEALNLFRWNEDGTALENVETADLITTAQFSNFKTDTFVDGIDFTAGTTTTVTLDSAPGTKANTQVYFDGVYQEKSEYSLAGTVVTFTSAIPSFVGAVEVVYGKAADVLAPSTREVQIADGVATAYTLSNSYEPGNGTLHVYINGVRQEVGYGYAETNDSTVTFDSAPANGDRLLFLVNPYTPQTTADANNVTYTHPASGAVATNVGARLSETVSVKDFGAVGDGVTDDTAAIQSALAASDYVFFPDGEYLITQAYMETLDSALIAQFSGPGYMVAPETGYNQQQLSAVSFSGSHKSRGGEARVNRKGGYFVGHPDDPRGIQLHTEECSSWAFIKERSVLGDSAHGQALLFTLQPNLLTVNGTVTVATDPDQIDTTSGTGTFDADDWPVDALIHFNSLLYRVGSVDSANTMTIVNDDGDPENRLGGGASARTAVTLTADATDNCMLPGHYFSVTVDTSGTAMTVIGGDDCPRFGTYDYNNYRVMVKIGSTWYTVASDSSRYNFTLGSSAGVQTGVAATILYQPDYSIQFSLKKTSGQGLEETFKIRSDADAWRVISTGSNVAQHKPIVFEAGLTGEVSGATYESLKVGGQIVQIPYALAVVAQEANVANGATVDINDGTSHFIGYQTGTRASATITLPSNPINGHIITVSSAGEITALTVQTDDGNSLAGAPSTIAANGFFSMIFSESRATWYRC